MHIFYSNVVIFMQCTRLFSGSHAFSELSVSVSSVLYVLQHDGLTVSEIRRASGFSTLVHPYSDLILHFDKVGRAARDILIVRTKATENTS